jgi:RecA-family ATPase
MSTHDKRAAAVALARRGFRVFKLVDGHKRPLSAGFSDLASNDIAIVHRRWSDPVSGEAQDYNPAIATDEYLVIDVDVKNGLRGFDSLAVLEDYGLDTNTLTARTPTGGAHLFYRLPPGVRVQLSNGRRLGEGLDVRGYHGLVVGAGAVFPNGTYEWANDVPMLDAPQWLIDMCGQPPVRAESAGKVLGELDTDASIARATVWLTEDAPIARIGSANVTTYAVAARVADYGISEHKTFELLQDHYLQDKCEGTWDDQALMDTIHNAYAYRNEPVGWRNPEAEFEAVEPGAVLDRRLTAMARPKGGIEFIEWDDIDPLSDPVTAQIEGWFDLGSLVVGYGAPNAGKTHVFLSMAVSIAAGQPWCGRNVRQGGVVYVAAEGGRGLKRRAGAYRKKYGWKKIPFWLRSGALDLMRPDGDIKGFIQKIKDIQATGQSVELIVIDTLARVMAGGDENSTKEMSAFVRNCDLIREATGCTVLLVHHTGKDKTKGSRGSNALLGAVDTELMVEANKVWSTKQRDAEKAAPISFALETVDLGVDANGRPQAGVVLKQTAAAEFEARLNENEKTLLEAFDKLLLGLENDDEDCDEVFGPRPSATWKQLRSCASAAGVKATAFSLALRSLCGVGLIYKNEQNQYVRGPAPEVRS